MAVRGALRRRRRGVDDDLRRDAAPPGGRGARPLAGLSANAEAFAALQTLAAQLPELERPSGAYLVAVAALLTIVVAAAVAFVLQSRGTGDPAALERRIGRALARLEIDSLEGHVVVCGAGDLGEAVADELARRGVPLVIVDRDAAAARRARAFFPHVYEGDARDPETLRRVGAGRARALVVCASARREQRRVAAAARRANRGLPVLRPSAGAAPRDLVRAALRGRP